MQRNEEGFKVMEIGDSFSVFSEIPGTFKYWQKAKHELIAKCQQLGPFHLFFTLSCAEKRMFELFTTILEKSGHQVTYRLDNDGNWTGDEKDILVEGIPLWEFVNTKVDRNELLRNNTVLITRIFDDRVKAFVKNIILGTGQNRIKAKYFCYRIDVQVRGMPHVHGVIFLEDGVLTEDSLAAKQGIYDEDREKLFIETFISCELPSDNEELNLLVNTLQRHNHTKTCKKRSTFCRFGFPRFPSDETIIAKPLSDDLPEEEKKY